MHRSSAGRLSNLITSKLKVNGWSVMADLAWISSIFGLTLTISVTLSGGNFLCFTTIVPAANHAINQQPLLL